MKRAVIYLGYQCNNYCRFCTNLGGRQIYRTTSEIKKEIILAHQHKNTILDFIGGEPTIRPDFIDLIKFAGELRFQGISLTTNGRMFSYYEFAKKMARLNLTEIIFSIHGPNAKIHNFLTRVPDSFEQTLRGINNLRKLGLENIKSNTVIVKQNYQYLPEIAKFLKNRGVKSSEFTFLDTSTGGAHRYFKNLVPQISLVAPKLKTCLSLNRENTVANFPLCHFNKYLNQVRELIRMKIPMQSRHFIGSSEINMDQYRSKNLKVKTKKCINCKLNNLCEGISKEYYQYYGDEELNPII